jgi:hypothetical protein
LLIEQRRPLGSLIFIRIAFVILAGTPWLIEALTFEQFKNGSGIVRLK